MAKLMRRNCLAMACLAMVAGLLLSAERAKADDRSDAPPSFPSFTTPSASPSTATFTKPSVFTKPPVAVAAPTIPQAVNVPNVLTRFPEMTARPRVMPTAAPLPVLPKRVQNVLDFYGGATSQRVLAQLPVRPSSGAARPTLPRQTAKPFQNKRNAPTISPYLNLFREENNQYLPNYHAYVRPQREIRRSYRHQEAEISRLQQRVQTVSYGASVGANTQQGAPSTGHSTRYFNTAGFYAPVNVKR